MRPKKSIEVRLRECTNQFEELTTSGRDLVCKICSVEIKYDLAHLQARVKEHVNSANHKKNSIDHKTQPRIEASLERANFLKRTGEEFRQDLCSALIAADIPLAKLRNSMFKSFLERRTGQKLPSISVLRSGTVETIYNRILASIRNTLMGKSIYLIIDETTDIMDRMQVNFLVGCLDGSPSTPMLAFVDYVDIANSSELYKSFLKCCRVIWPEDDIPYENIKLILTDQAAYMVKSVELMKILAADALHVTCVVHAFHRVAETLRSLHPTVNEFLGKFKEILRGSKRRKRLFMSKTGLTSPPKPVITRWATWLIAAKYHCDNFDKVKKFVVEFNGSAQNANDCKELMVGAKLRDELYSLSDYFFLIDVIFKLEKRNLRLDDSLEIVGQAFDKLLAGKLDGPREKIKKSFIKNPDYTELFSIKDITKKINFKYAPITSVDVERSFSRTKSLLESDRTSFTESNLKFNYIINYNSFLLSNENCAVRIE